MATRSDTPKSGRKKDGVKTFNEKDQLTQTWVENIEKGEKMYGDGGKLSLDFAYSKLKGERRLEMNLLSIKKTVKTRPS